MRLTLKEQSECGMFCPGWQKWLGMFCPGMFCPAPALSTPIATTAVCSVGVILLLLIVHCLLSLPLCVGIFVWSWFGDTVVYFFVSQSSH